MSINACSINAHTINALCRRRQVVPAEIVYGHGASALHSYAPPEQEIREPIKFELPEATVSVMFDGKVYSQTQSMTAFQLDFVTVTKLRLNELETVHINNLRVSDHLDDLAVNIHDLRL